MTLSSPAVLSLNGGSSSLRFALYRLGAVLERRLSGKIDRIGLSEPRLQVTDIDGAHLSIPCPAATDMAGAAQALLGWLDTRGALVALRAVGHRLVHGMSHTQAELVTPALLAALHGFEALDPDHLPGELGLIEALRQRAPALAQVVCFDTAFHADLPRVARLLAIPRRYEAQGVRRYGFHGLSYASLMEELARTVGVPAAQGRVVLAHLGSGASMAAVRGGRSIDTSMGFTPAAGLPMGTRSGDLDPGLVAYLARTEAMTPAQFDALVNHASGLLGLSETSADMRDLLAAEATDPRAADAVALFCYQAKKCLGGYAAALGGLDQLVFSGGIGESSPVVRGRICAGLGFLGIELDPARNAADADVISTDASAVTVHVMRTDEELMVARAVCQVLELD